MGFGVTRIEYDHDLVVGTNKFTHSLDDFRRGGISLDESNVACKLMAFDRPTVLGTDLDVDAHDASLATHRLEQGGIEDQRTSVRHTSLDDDVWTQREDDLLQSDQILRML